MENSEVGQPGLFCAHVYAWPPLVQESLAFKGAGTRRGYVSRTVLVLLDGGERGHGLS